MTVADARDDRPGRRDRAVLCRRRPCCCPTCRGRPGDVPTRWPSRPVTGTTSWSRPTATVGFEMCADLCGVDYLTHPGRDLPDGVVAERFEVVVNLLSLSQKRRVRVRVQVPETDPEVPSLFDLYPGVDAMEREAFDLVGIVFDRPPGPDPDPHARGLGGPPAAQGLRRRPGSGAVQGGSGPAMTRRDLVDRDRRPVEDGSAAPVAETSEGAQELLPRPDTGAGELRREVGAVLRLPEGRCSTRPTSTSSAATTRR